MQLLIPKDEAIKILQQRLQELTQYGFNPKVWKDRTILDLKQIFGLAGDQWLQISSIYFDTAITSQKAQKLQEGRQAASGLLNSYIDFIEQYSKIAAQRKQIQENGFEQKYYQLLADYNKNGQEYINLMDEHSKLLDENSALIDEKNEVEEENQRLVDNTLQLDNVTFKRLWVGVQNLPTIQIVYITSVIIAIIIASFTVGQLIEKNSANNESFELKSENRDLKNSNQTISTQLESKKSEIQLLKDSIKVQSDSIIKLNKPKVIKH